MDTKQCKGCNKEKSVNEFHKDRQYVKSYCKICDKERTKQWRQNNPTKVKIHKEAYREQNRKAVRKYLNKVPAGIYYIYEEKELVYIGESGRPLDRLSNHFSLYSKEENAKLKSPIAYALYKGELDKANLSYKMYKFIDDETERETEEDRLINKYKPKYNTLGC